MSGHPLVRAFLAALTLVLMFGCCKPSARVESMTAPAEEDSDQGPPPADLDVEPGGGNLSTAPSMTARSVEWSFGRQPAVVGPPAIDLYGQADPAINKRVLKYKVKKSQGFKDRMKPDADAIKQYTLTVDSHCGGQNSIKVVLEPGQKAAWYLNGTLLKGRDPRVDREQLPCEFFGELVGDIEVTLLDNTTYSADRARIKWKR